MATLADVLSWDAGRLSSTAARLASSRSRLVDLQDEIDGAKPPLSWQAGAAIPARELHERLRLRLNDLAAEVSDVDMALEESIGNIKKAQAALQQRIDEAEGAGFTVARGSGVIMDSRTYETQTDADKASARMDEIAHSIKHWHNLANEADATLAKALNAAARGKVEGGAGSIADAVVQLPPSLDGLTPDQLAERIGKDVAIATISAYLNAEFEVASWKIEGAANADYKIMADGSVVMALHLEAGLGRGVNIGGAEADVSGGGAVDLEMRFKSQEEAQRFLDGIDDAALDLGVTDLVSPPAAVASNVWEYIEKHNPESIKTGIYGKVSGEVDIPGFELDAEGRVDGYYDWKKEEFGVKGSASIETDLGGKGANSGVEGKLDLAVEGKYKTEGDDKGFTELNFTGAVNSSADLQKFGVDVPGLKAGGGADVEFKMNPKDPGFTHVQEALQRGDMDQAAKLALENGQVVIRQTATTEISGEDEEFDIGVAEGKVEAGIKETAATQVWVKPSNTSTFVELGTQGVGK